jgi:hypothetical protein
MNARYPASLTTAGQVVTTYMPGPANDLIGLDRVREMWCRFRQQHGRATTVRLLWAARRHGLALTSEPIAKGSQPNSGNGD